MSLSDISVTFCDNWFLRNRDVMVNIVLSFD